MNDRPTQNDPRIEDACPRCKFTASLHYRRKAETGLDAWALPEGDDPLWCDNCGEVVKASELSC